MAVFSIEFARGQLAGPEYEDYNVTGPLGICFDDARQHPIKFNDNITGDYVVGWNWSNPSFGLPPGSIRIESFTDITETIELSTGLVVNTQTSPANTLRDNTAGVDLTYPYITPMSNLGNIVENFNQNEIMCFNSGSDKYRNTRTRIVEYILFDTAGNPGPLRTARYDNFAPV